MVRKPEAHIVEVTLDIAAKPETVYRFLTDPVGFRQWMGEHSSLDEATSAISVKYPNGDEAVGELIEAVAPTHVVYLWGYRGDKHGIAPGTTRVVIDLVATKDGTRLVLRHEGLPAEDVRRNHEIGWQYYVGQLGTHAAAEQVAPHIAAAMDDYVLAWNTGDPAERASAVQRSCEDTVVYQDRMAYTRTAASLLRHITGARAFAPDVKLIVVQPPIQCHQHVRYDWKIVGPQGQTYGSGVGVGRLSLEGRFAHVVSFWDG